MENTLPPISKSERTHLVAGATQLLERLEFVALPSLNDKLLESSATLTIRLEQGLRERETTIEELRALVATLQNEAQELRQGHTAALQETHEIYRETMDRQSASYQSELKAWKDGYSLLESQLSALKRRHSDMPEIMPATSPNHA